MAKQELNPSDKDIEDVQSEIDDNEVSPASYDIITYPADYTLPGLLEKFKKTPSQIIFPGFQRKFVWNIKQASRLIESFLLGLPVPAIFLFTETKTNRLLVVDGQQRLKSIFYFLEGHFGEETKGKRKLFKLTGLNEQSPYNGKTYEDFEAGDETAYNKLDDSVLRAFIIKQLTPDDNTSMYHIFERLNTGGTHLVGQEIRNCIYHGKFNELLIKLNTNDEWRELFGNKSENKRQRDVELILRFFALLYKGNNYKKPMKDFLSKFMAKNQDPAKAILNKYENKFTDVTTEIKKKLGEKPFHIRKGLNAATMEAVYVAFAKNMANIPSRISARYKNMIKTDPFLELVSSRTTDEDTVSRRLKLVENKLFH